MSADSCPTCGKRFERIGRHWSHNPQHRPNFTEKQMDILTGILMSDGHIDRSGTPLLVLKTTNDRYLNHLKKQFGVLSNEPYLYKEKSGRANDMYNWTTKSHVQLKELGQWYSSGKKTWPEDISLTPTVLKHLFIGDGSYSKHGSNDHISISIANERQNTEKVEGYFENVDLPTPSNWTEHGAHWNVEDSETLWEYMGEPLPGYEYKWK
ncbi:LAGLIDADG endonuclease [Haloarcula virus HVTV-2]|nr:LAGLIDADG endonuclease [Haloarcula virus HVTV-2]